MSEQEKKSNAGADSSSVAIEQSAGSRHKQPYRPTELQEAVSLHHNRSKAPAVSSVAEEWKNLPEDSCYDTQQQKESERAVAEELKNLSEDSSDDTKEQKESEPEISSDKYKQNLVKKLSSSAKRRDSSPVAIHGENKTMSSHSKSRESSPESITLATVNVEVKKSVAPQPIPTDMVSVSSGTAFGTKVKVEVESSDEDSITEDVAELRNPEPVARHSEWSDEEEAGGLSRSESRASRVSRAVRQLFCCGTTYEAASEDNVSYTRGYSSGI